MEYKTCNTCHKTKSLFDFDCYGGKYRGYCTDCRRGKDRVLAEKRRREKGVVKAKGVEATCIDCGSKYIKNSVHTKRCRPCAKELILNRARTTSLSKARDRGNRVMGSEQTCQNCGVAFLLDQKRAKYCLSCRELQKKGALPFMKERSKIYSKQYLSVPKNKEKATKTANKYKRERRETDPIYALIGRCRARVNQAFREGKYTKRSRTHEIIGCSWEYLMGYIEAQFKDGMTWGNRDKWHIDHKVPLSLAKTEDDVIRLSHYTNLQPLWAEENQRKSNRLNFEQKT